MGLGWFADASINYRSGYNTGADLDEPKYQGGFAVVDGRIGITRADGWEVYAWGKNLFNHPYRVVASDAFLQPNTFTSFIGAPATYGVAVKAKF
jgi:outer membrane receptor protein involved in Fe transport